MIVFAALALAAGILGSEPQETETKVMASNGSVITVRADAFAGRTVYEAETVSGDRTAIQVTVTKTREGFSGPFIVATIGYSGDWRFYDAGVFRGGDAAPVSSVDRRVGRCSASRYGSSCTLRETVAVEVTPEMIAERGENGLLSIQVTGRTPDNFMVETPIDRLQAVMEVSGMLAGPDAAAAPEEAPTVPAPPEA